MGAWDYDPPRKTDLANYGGPRWKLSRSKISMFLNCRKCSFIDNRLGLTAPPGFPFNLNKALDMALKNEANYIRKMISEGHDLPFPQNIETMPTSLAPLMEQSGMRPFIHKDVAQWQKERGGVEYYHGKETDFEITGILDDVWTPADPTDDTLFVVDYKGTAKKEVPNNLKTLIYDDYKRQIEIYQYLLRKNGFNVSNKGYFVYAIAKSNPENLNYYLEFDVVMIEYEGNDDWIEGTIQEIKQCFDQPKSAAAGLPEGADCDLCKYRGAFRKI